eukprot:augustus_masked-scaffold_13-processed-gene-3.12-mRNA-1 protein AED:0.17 eAED:0.19 QI:0/-1/0/1/-1/1/1/0/355
MSSTVQELDYVNLVALKNGTLSKKEKELLLNQIEKAYGPDGLGILTVKNVPNYQRLRENLLTLAPKVAKLPPKDLESIMDKPSNFQVGWSHGIEVLENGEPDMLKGSFYANVVYNTPSTDEEMLKKYPSYTRPNLWPKSALPQLETSFLTLGGLINKTGLLLAHACDEYIKTKVSDFGSLEESIRKSRNCKGRLLHYFPKPKGFKSENNWCGVHCDHGTLTGLCRAMFLDPQGKEVGSPDKNAGLYIIVNNKEVKVSIPEKNLGFQLGQAAQIQSNGFLRATPHLVRGADDTKISRNTFAVFLQPHWLEKLDGVVEPKKLGVTDKEFNKGITFGQFSENLVSFYHKNGTETFSKL